MADSGDDDDATMGPLPLKSELLFHSPFTSSKTCDSAPCVEEEDVHDARVADRHGQRCPMLGIRQAGVYVVSDPVVLLAADVLLGGDEVVVVVLPDQDPAMQVGFFALKVCRG